MKYALNGPFTNHKDQSGDAWPTSRSEHKYWKMPDSNEGKETRREREGEREKERDGERRRERDIGGRGETEREEEEGER